MYIVVEGQADKNFLKQLFKKNFKGTPEFIITDTNSCSLSDDVIRLIKTNTRSLSEPTIFILDADCQNEQRQPDYETSKNCLIESFREFDNPLSEESIFLFPNGESPGCLEDLLAELMTQKSESIFDCYTEYQQCVEKIDAGYQTPNDLKTLLFIYSYATSGNGSETSRSYTDPEIWNLDSPALNPLLDFLRNHLENA